MIKIININRFKTLLFIFFALLLACFFTNEKAYAVSRSDSSISSKVCSAGGLCFCNQNAAIVGIGGNGASPSGFNKILCANFYKNDGSLLYWNQVSAPIPVSRGGSSIVSNPNVIFQVNFTGQNANPNYSPDGLCPVSFKDSSNQSLQWNNSGLATITYYAGNDIQCPSNFPFAAGIGDANSDGSIDTLYCVQLSEPANVPTPTPTPTPPQASFSLSGSSACSGSTSYNSLSWTSYSGATRYQIWRNGSAYTTTTGTGLNDASISQGTQYSYQIGAYNGSSLMAASNTIFITSAACGGSGAISWNTPSVSCTGNASVPYQVNLSWNSSVSDAYYYNLWRDSNYVKYIYTTSTTDTVPSKPLGYHVYAMKYDTTWTGKSTGDLCFQGQSGCAMNYSSWPTCGTPPSGFTFRYNGASCSGSNLVYNFSWGTLSSATAYMFISRDEGLSDFVYPPTLSYGYPGSRFPNIFSTKSSADFEAVGVNGNNYSWATPVAGNGATVVTTSFSKPGLRVPKSSLNCAQPPTVNMWADNTNPALNEEQYLHFSFTNVTSGTITGECILDSSNACTSSSALTASEISSGGGQRKIRSTSTGTKTYRISVTGAGGTTYKDINLNVSETVGTFGAIFIANSIVIERSSTLNISQDSNAINNPPPGFADLAAPIFKEIAP